MMKLFWKAFINTLTRMLTKPLWAILLFSLCIMSTAYIKGSINDLPIAVVDMDNSYASQQLKRKLDASSTIAVVAHDDLNQAIEALNERELFAVVIIPRHFEGKILRSETVTIQAYGDTTNRMANGMIQQDISVAYQQLLMQYNASLLKNAGFSKNQLEVLLTPIQAQQDRLFNDGLNFAVIILPGVLVMLLQHSLLIASSRINIALNSLPQSPPRAVYLGALTALLPIWLFLSIVLFVLWPILHGFRQMASIGLLLLLTFPFLLSVLGLSKFITSCLTRVDLIYLSVSLMTTPVFYLSGAVWPLQMMPIWVKGIAYMLPSTWATNMIIGVNQIGESVEFDTIGINVIMLLVLGAFYALLGLFITQLRNGKIRSYFRRNKVIRAASNR